jgi:hypothetical protein
MMEAVSTSEKSVNFNQTTRCNNPEDIQPDRLRGFPSIISSSNSYFINCLQPASLIEKRLGAIQQPFC